MVCLSPRSQCVLLLALHKLWPHSRPRSSFLQWDGHHCLGLWVLEHGRQSRCCCCATLPATTTRIGVHHWKKFQVMTSAPHIHRGVECGCACGSVSGHIIWKQQVVAIFLVQGTSQCQDHAHYVETRDVHDYLVYGEVPIGRQWKARCVPLCC